MYKTIIKLWQDGKSKKFISRAVNHDIKTIRKIIKLHEQEVAGIHDQLKSRLGYWVITKNKLSNY